MSTLSTTASFLAVAVTLPLASCTDSGRTSNATSAKGEDPIRLLNRSHAAMNENAASLYDKAAEAAVPPRGKDWGNLDVRSKLHPSAEVVEWLSANRNALSALQNATRLSNCWWNLTRDATGTSIMSPTRAKRISQMKGLGALALAQSAHAWSSGDAGAAANALVMADTLGRHLLEQATLLEIFAGQEIVEAGLRLALELVRDGRCPTAKLKTFADGLSPMFSRFPQLEPVWRTERDLLGWALRRSPLFRPEAEAALDELLVHAQTWSKQPLDVAFLRDYGLSQMVDRNWPPGRNGSPARALKKHILLSFAKLAESRHLQSGLEMGLRLQRYRVEHGEWPSSLSGLIEKEQLEMFAESPFVYHVSDGTCVLYSLGVDGDDDGGQHNEEALRFEEIGIEPGLHGDGDFVFLRSPRP